ncbi:hypothetical protein PFAG_05403 [Plasmodium falciparum Santa Lucia]|uniref:SF-assemblin, putative n=14 Tax=Plasmodium falciparum TaxID=5833 RepID=Q8ILD3_PLAF7|nr:SF-assemblin, putative [Plasmodium falciparum 3D7]ETW16118.1 hypothetical protein PFFVO_04950 [Plasmodium falciparum Vietnam Oak-Knoll (FVO)]ETW34012.1 hypothetical protein PFTANZ_05285 [Plasmodium falciparum Tanzania (2000708)]ETW39952.1 hypothetical protein PFNF135_05978 [Plasmodium falciparum NF135/5.C10]ETW53970.1 hypothetical protein PFUGPA_03843 [Plasmodium falciparum Palo Alto/Uganda]ETW58275.1 hypothetical protein PFMC_05379 [Plasmodium falciparum CAMP/Malaysia]EUR63245.1 hypotheti|eukprot:XP_001348485.1 SF-assemblin, putative [Plasmodium falciparum 3D7]
MTINSDSSTVSDIHFDDQNDGDKNKINDMNLFNDSDFFDEGRNKKKNSCSNDNFYEEMKYDILRIERNINSEVKKRLDANKNIQLLIEQMANNMINNVLNKITTKIESISSDLDKIIHKCEELEKVISQIKVDIPTKIQTDMISLKREIADFQLVINKYLNNKKKRDNILYGKIENISAYLTGKIQSEIAFKQHDLSYLKNESDRLLNYDNDDDVNFKNVFLQEVEEIKDALNLTVKAREQSDDDIIQAMNKYTSVLQKALQSAIINTN